MFGRYYALPFPFLLVALVLSVSPLRERRPEFLRSCELMLSRGRCCSFSTRRWREEGERQAGWRWPPGRGGKDASRGPQTARSSRSAGATRCPITPAMNRSGIYPDSSSCISGKRSESLVETRHSHEEDRRNIIKGVGWYHVEIASNCLA